MKRIVYFMLVEYSEIDYLIIFISFLIKQIIAIKKNFFIVIVFSPKKFYKIEIMQNE